jgi:hypothetical protein
MSRTRTFFSILYPITVGLNLGLATSYTYDYFSKPNLVDVNIIKPQAVIVGNYTGNAPSVELDRLIDRIEIVKVDNPNYASDIDQLENTITEAKIAIGDTSSPSVYSPIMDTVAKSADDFVNGHYRSGWLLGLGIMWFGLAGLNTYSMINNRKTAARREERERWERAEAVENRARADERLAAALRRARNTDARDDDNNLWRNRDDGNDGNQL